MTGTPAAVSDPSASRRRAWPPWQVALGFSLLLCGRFINSRLAFSMRPDTELSLFNTSFLFIVGTFWFWPSVTSDAPNRSASPWGRWGMLTTLLCLIPAGVHSPHQLESIGGRWLGYAVTYGIYGAALTYQFPRLFADLRLDPTIPASSALGPCALFFFYSLMVPALVESIGPGSSSYLHWIMLAVPPLTALLIALDLRERPSKRGWWRELAGLLWKTAPLPFLFLLGEAVIVALGVSSGY